MTAQPITICLLGSPQGKGRARAFVRGHHVGHYTPEKTRTYALPQGVAPEVIRHSVTGPVATVLSKFLECK